MNEKSFSEILREYLKDRVKIIAAFVLFTLLIFVVLLLSNLPIDGVLYAILIAIVPIATFSMIDFYKYRRRSKELYKMHEAIVRGLSQVEVTGSTVEKELSKDINELCSYTHKLIARSAKLQEDADAYYTMWAHQIKTPIAAMRLLLEQAKGEEGELLRQELFKIERYVEMVLGYLRTNSMNSDLQFKSYEVQGVVRGVVKKFAPIFIYKNIGVEIADFENRVLTDEKWLSFVLEQLISNALKYTEEGGKIKIYMDEEDILYIEDNGCGISAEDLPRVFERGYTGYNGRTTRTSTGLGLYLCKRILSNLSNEIKIISTEGKGTTVELNLHRKELITND